MHSAQLCLIYIVSSINLLLGHPYALFLGHRWRRVLVEMSTRGVVEVFSVDTGIRTAIQSNMEFHQLPQRLLIFNQCNETYNFVEIILKEVFYYYPP